MIGAFIQKLKLIFADGNLRKRIFFVLGALAVFRILASIPIPSVDKLQLASFLESHQYLGLMNMFSGGGLSNLSIVMLGVSPYITASIIMQLMSIMSPTIKALHTEEGEIGRQKFTQYSRMLTIPLAFVQAFGFLMLLSRQGIVGDLTMFSFIVNVMVVAAGSILLMWVGELISEFGIGNGVSLIIFAGIVASLPTTIGQVLFNFDMAQIPTYIAFIIVAVLVTAVVVIITEAERPVPVSYAKQVRGGKSYGGVSTYLPLRVNQAGVIPIIFALSIILFPQMILSFFQGSETASVADMASTILTYFTNPWIYAGVYFVLVFFFTYFYTAVTFDPQSISTNLQKSGAFIPGVRPGAATAEYLGNIITRITLVGALFLGLIAVLPLAMQGITNNGAFAIGGTALLIAVSVVLDIVRKVDAQISIREY
ncbi:MAG: Protein translocase subunit SecY [Parcubacteria group bacterium GW2011_GWA2_43_11]|nr:MAG: Protein translocase subunit SecY [Parcubacteria group bacterium GW2011_GWC2_42_11]KKS85996.1 MAG: Protein translocase subunit SecY [Parcubacteria group bacterium GW2011_GWA2_43_11]